MPCYVDNMINYGRRIGNAGPNWCHLIADTPDELHAMAARIGLLRRWFQDGRRPHYDIGTYRVRDLAISFGAITCERRDFVEHMRRINASAHWRPPQTPSGADQAADPPTQSTEP